MIKQTINVNNYWKVIIYYDINYNLFDIIVKELISIKTKITTIKHIYYNMFTRRAKAVTTSNIKLKQSVVLFNKHKTKEDYINSVVHEAEHVKQAILKAYNIEDKGEPPAYTMGYLVVKMLMFFEHII